MLFSVSATTRLMRDSEADGRDYYFLTSDEFQRKIRFDEFVEWEEIYGDYYGSLKSEVERALSHNKVMLFDVDVKGALTIKSKYSHDTLLIFVKPPSLEVLRERLSKRKTEDEETIRKRLERVPMELEKEKEFDFFVINDDLQRAVEAVDRVVTAAMDKPGRIIIKRK